MPLLTVCFVGIIENPQSFVLQLSLLGFSKLQSADQGYMYIVQFDLHVKEGGLPLFRILGWRHQDK